MSSSPRLIVVLIGAFLFLGASVFRVHAADLTLSPRFHLPGLTFMTPLTFGDGIPNGQTLFLEFRVEQAFEIVTPTHSPSPTLEPTATEDTKSNNIQPTGLTIEEMIPTPTPTSTPTPTPLPTATPTPLPTATPTPAPTSPPAPVDIEALFSRYSDEYHVDKDLLKRIANCESSFNSNAVYGDYLGMFQFATQSWVTVRSAMGQDTNPDLRKSPEESIKTAAYKISVSGPSAWPSCH